MDHRLLIDILELLIAAVILVPLFMRLGLGSVLGYLTAGVILGPSVLAQITDVEEIRHFAEFGVMFLLFIIGIEMKPARLWAIRHSVFGLGAAQVLVTSILLGSLIYLFTQDLAQSVIIGSSLALSSTAMGIQLMSERGELHTVHGRSSLAVLLFQDLSVVPLVGIVPLLVMGMDAWQPTLLLWGVIEVVLMVVVVILVGRYLFPRLLHLVAVSRTTPELFVAASLLVVLGSAVLVSMTGLSMALGAFLAGLLLSESEYRHQVMVDIQPFRGLLLGLFFMAVGMSMDLHLLRENISTVLALVAALLLIKGAVLLGLARLFGHSTINGLEMAALLSQGGEFSFILFGLASQQGLLSVPLFQELVVIVALSMAFTPMLVSLVAKLRPTAGDAPVAEPEEQSEAVYVLIAGFGRVGQRLARILDEVNISYLAVERDTERIEAARAKGLKVMYGDPARLEMAKSLGLDRIKLLVCTLDNSHDAERLVEQARRERPQLEIIARGHDSTSCLQLLEQGADQVVSETLEASLRLAGDVLLSCGLASEEAQQVVNRFREANYGALIKQRDSTLADTGN